MKTITITNFDGRKTEVIDLTHMDFRKMIKKAYDLSVPQGLGFLNAERGPLPDTDVEGVLQTCRDSQIEYLSIDYLKGRSIKLYIHQVLDDQRKCFVDHPDVKFYMYPYWYDHSTQALEELLRCSVEEEG